VNNWIVWKKLKFPAPVAGFVEGFLTITRAYRILLSLNLSNPINELQNTSEKNQKKTVPFVVIGCKRTYMK